MQETFSQAPPKALRDFSVQPGLKVSTFFQILVFLAIISTTLAISSDPTISMICNLVSYSLWCLILIWLFFSKIRFKIPFIFCALLLVYGLSLLQGRLGHSNGFYRSSAPGTTYVLYACALFYLVGYNINRRMDIRTMVFAFATGQIILIFLRMSHLMQVNKNAVGILVGLGIILELFCLARSSISKLLKLLGLVVGIFSVLYLIKLHSRTPLVAAFLAYAYDYSFRHKKAVTFFIVLTLAIALVISLPYLLQLDFVLRFLRSNPNAHKVVLTFDAISSYRGTMFLQAWEEFTNNFWTGIGGGAYSYTDCFPLYVLRSFGLLGALYILPISYGVFFFRLLKNTKYKQIMKVLPTQEGTVMISTINLVIVFFFAISTFEGAPPFGPGTSVFFLWVLLGKYDRMYDDGFYSDLAIQHPLVSPSMPMENLENQSQDSFSYPANNSDNRP